MRQNRTPEGAHTHMCMRTRENRNELTRSASFLCGENRTKSTRVWGVGFKKMERV